MISNVECPQIIIFCFLFIKYDIFSLIFQIEAKDAIENELSETKQFNETQENVISDATNNQTKITNTDNTSKVNFELNIIYFNVKLSYI